MESIPAYRKDTLQSLRIKLGYTQTEAARLLGISVPTLRNWEKDSTNLSLPEIKKIEEVYHTSMDYIFFGSAVAFSELIKNQKAS